MSDSILLDSILLDPICNDNNYHLIGDPDIEYGDQCE
jgi:hypothetical protein